MELAHSFNAIAAQYAAARPGYPPALLDAVEEIARRPLKGVAVLGEAAASILAGERGELLKIFPDGMVVEPYWVDLTVIVKAAAEVQP